MMPRTSTGHRNGSHRLPVAFAPAQRVTRSAGRLALGAFLLLAPLGCVSSGSSPGETGGATGSTGGGGPGTGGSTSAMGGTATGGTPATGGAPAGSGGTSVTGSGGAAAGGSSSSGGAAGAGSGTGGATGVGGASASGCDGKAYKLCESFEAGTVGGVPTGWTALRGYGSAQGAGLANDQFHSGTMALKSNSMTPGQSRVQKSLAGLGATANKHWGRLFYKVQSPAPRPASGVIHITFAALQGAIENRVVDTVEATNGTHQWLFNLPDDSCCAGSAYSWSFDTTWHCAEWYVDASTQSFRFFTDSKEVPAIAFTGRANARIGNYTSLAIGTIFYQTPPSPFVVWFDDLAIDDNQIGCQ